MTPTTEHKTNLDDENMTPDARAAYLREAPSAPVRILISTKTHLVPGDGYFAKTTFIQNTVSQYHWNCDFDWSCNRFNTYDAKFGFDNQNCYFLIDHGISNDDSVPVLWYKWTGVSLYETLYY